METPKGYTTIERIQNYMLIDIDGSFHSQINDWIAEVERYIDRETGRNFIADDEVSVRKFSGDGTDKLLIDDCIEVETVQLDKDSDALEQESGSGDFPWLTYPENAQDLNPKVPITRIEFEDTFFPKGKQNIKVGAKWGYSETCPPDITFAATVFMAGIINNAWESEGEVQSMTIGRYSVTYKTKQEVTDFEKSADILKHYKKFSF